MEVDKKEVYIPAVYIKKCEPDDVAWKAIDEIAQYLAYDETEFETREDGNNYRKSALISPCQYPYVNEMPGDENRECIHRFEDKIHDYRYHRFRLLHEYGGEEVFFIKDISLEKALALAKEFDQYTFIYKDEDGCREYCAKPFKDAKGCKYKYIEVVKYYETDAYGAISSSDFADIVLRKTKKVEIDGIKNGNNYDPKTWYELYYISDPYPKTKPPAPIHSFVRRMQLIESK